MTVKVADEGYTHLTVSAAEAAILRGKIEARRLDLAWEAFRKAGRGDYDRKAEVAYGESLPELPPSEVFDAESEAQAFPAWVLYNTYAGEQARTVWYLRWYRSAQEAQNSRATAQAKKAEADAAEFERRNFDRLVAEARDLARQVEEQWATIDLSKAPAYGLSEAEASPSYYGDGLSRRIAKAKELIEGWTKSPAAAIEALKALCARLQTAQETFVENTKFEPEAGEALEHAKVAVDLVREGEESGDLSWETLRETREALEAAEKAYRQAQYAKAVELSEALTKRVGEILAEAEGRRNSRELRSELIAREYATCPVCGSQVEEGYDHYCGTQWQEALRERGCGEEGYADFSVKVSRVGEAEAVSLVAVYNSRYGEYELRLRVNEDVMIVDLDAVTTETLWREPSQAERELLAKLGELEQRMARLEEERGRGGRVEVTFRSGTDPKGQSQFQAEGDFTGSVENRKSADGSGYSQYENQPAVFVSRPNCPWLEGEQPQSGQRWICTIGFQIGLRSGRPIITVKPQVRTDNEGQIREQIEALRRKLQQERERFTGNPFDEKGEPQTAIAAALRRAGLK